MNRASQTPEPVNEKSFVGDVVGRMQIWQNDVMDMLVAYIVRQFSTTPSILHIGHTQSSRMLDYDLSCCSTFDISSPFVCETSARINHNAGEILA